MEKEIDINGYVGKWIGNVVIVDEQPLHKSFAVSFFVASHNKTKMEEYPRMNGQIPFSVWKKSVRRWRALGWRVIWKKTKVEYK